MNTACLSQDRDRSYDDRDRSYDDRDRSRSPRSRTVPFTKLLIGRIPIRGQCRVAR